MSFSDAWPRLTLKAAGVGLLDCDHRTPTAAEEGYPYIAIPQLKNGHILLEGVRRISRDDYVGWTKKLKPQANDVIVVRRCNSGDSAHVPPGLECAIGQNLVILRADGKIVLPEFLRWLINGPDWWDQVSKYLNVGAVFDSLRCRDIPNFELTVPPIDHQRDISTVLGALDDRISLLRETNATLESIAQALFKSWFVDFDTVRAKQEGREPEGMDANTAALFPDSFEESEKGMIPKDWNIKRVEDVAEKVGMGPFGSNIKIETFVAQGIPVISGQHLRHTLMEDLSFNFITEAHAEKLKNSCVGAGDVVFTHAGNIGQVALIHNDARFDKYVLSQRQFFLRCNKEKMLPVWIAYFFRSPQGQHLLLANASQVGVPSIARPVSYLRSIEFVVPPINILLRFSELIDSLHKQVIANRARILNLAILRDTLLPRLISGQLRLPDAG